jgi:hypothetical protein
MPKKPRMSGLELIMQHQGEEPPVPDTKPRTRVQNAAKPATRPIKAAEEPAPPTASVPSPEPANAAGEPDKITGEVTPAGTEPVPATQDSAGEGESPSLEAPAEQPGKFWDTTGAPVLPSGWTTKSLEAIVEAERRGMPRIRGTVLLPDDMYDACFDWIWMMKERGVTHTFNHIAELALEAIPPDDEGLRRLLDEVPAPYFASMTTRSHVAALFPLTNQEARKLPYRLKKLGFRRHARLLHSALIARALADLSGWTWPDVDSVGDLQMQ